MILIFDPDSDRLYQKVVSGFTSLAVIRRWIDLHRLAPAADCCVVLIRHLDERTSLRRLEWYRRDFPAQPTVLILEWCRDNLRRLDRLPGCEVVWLGGSERDLSETVQSTIAAALRRPGLDRARPRWRDPPDPPPFGGFPPTLRLRGAGENGL